MRIATAQKLLLLVDLALFAGGAKVAWDVFQENGRLAADQKATNLRLQKELSEIKPSEITPPRVPTYAELQTAGKLLAGDWKIPEKKPVEVDQPKTSTAPKINLGTRIQVIGIQSPDFAHLKDKKNAAGELVLHYTPNQEVSFVPGCYVKRIDPMQVVFDYQGEEHIVIYEPDAGAGSSGGSDGPSTPGRDPRIIPIASGVTYQSGSSKVEVSRDAVFTAQKQGADEVLKGVRIGSVRHTDGKSSVQFDDIPAQSPLARGGLQNGDYLVSINGDRVTSKPEAVQYLKANPNRPSYTVVIMRQGRKVVRVVTVK